MISVESLLQSHPPDIQAIVTTLRQLIFDTVPTATESVKAGWHSLSFRHPQQGYFCGIFPAQDKVTLVFEFGILLPDPDNVLEGDGKQVRNVLIYDQGDILAEAIQKLLIEAINLPVSRNDKLALIHSGARPVETDNE